MNPFNTNQERAELTFEQVSVISGLGHTRLLDRISFRIEAPGSKVGIVGASGSGKTTLLRLVNRLIDPTEGRILWQGQPHQNFLAPLLRQRIMLVPQESQLLGMTVEQALVYPLQLQKLPTSEIQKRIERWERHLDIPSEWKSRQALELSVGQRQWVSLCRALMAQPQMLLLDEPTSALDPGRIERLCNILRQLDCSVLIVSHQFSVLQSLCDRILWIDQGQLRQDCATQDVNWSEVQTALSTKTAASSDWTDFNETFS